uniref:Uncharacterized protein n=1 Tax=Meloidogyne enterolobii TaxID=390850 RepID=A0A6V7VNV8_MELEN|nr:unnamed protein product [Meloidogyne enterolobii]
MFFQALHLSGNNLKRINGDEFTSAPNLHLLNLANNNIYEINNYLNLIAPHLEKIILEENRIEELPIFIKNIKNLRQIYLGGNPFRCDCSSNGRFLAQEWISLNQQKIKDAGKIQCVENVTRAKETNDTTIFSNYFPNINDDLFVMSMLEFLNQENRTICIEQSKRIFGVFEYADTMMIILFIIAILVFFTFLIITVAKSCFQYLNDVQKQHKPEKKKCQKNNRSPVTSSESMTLIDRRLISPRQYSLYK